MRAGAVISGQYMRTHKLHRLNFAHTFDRSISVPFRSPHLSYLELPLDKVVPINVNIPTTSLFFSPHVFLLVEPMSSIFTTSSVDPT